jgi:hypothetical protein
MTGTLATRVKYWQTVLANAFIAPIGCVVAALAAFILPGQYDPSFGLPDDRGSKRDHHGDTCES